MTAPVPHPIEILHGEGVGLACDLDGAVHAEEPHGLFAGDTRVLSSYRFSIGGAPWRVLCRSRPDPSVARWELTNPPLRAPGGLLEEATLHLSVERRVSGALADELVLTSFAPGVVRVRFAIQIDADFADLFEVRDGSLPPHLGAQRIGRGRQLDLIYDRRGFRRALHVRFTGDGDPPAHVGALAIFDLVLRPRDAWRCRLDATPEVDGVLLGAGAPRVEPPSEGPLLAGDRRLERACSRGRLDLERLVVRDGDTRHVAAGAPWFLTLFGRDVLLTTLMASVTGAELGRGTLAALDRTQARVRDDFRDAQPGKLAHELRRGELAHAGVIPHTPYYGTHDAPALYVLALWNAWRWTGDRRLLDRHLGAAERALDWCERDGDLDGDGLLEYRTRSRLGYRNQGWKDAGDAIPHLDGRLAAPPVATVELQGYWFAARLAMAELFDARDRRHDAEAMRAAAARLRELVDRRFWSDEEGCYAVALDGEKRPVRTVASNPGHLLWSGLPDHHRARRLAARLLADDMFSGWGIRTLSAAHARYNPLSYQCGSVWPHDNGLIAAGLVRYGLLDEAARVIDGMLDAAIGFEHACLPELFAGLPRGRGGPVPYPRANVPQAWASATPLLFAQLLAGIVPDVPAGRCYLSPWLPRWMPSLALDGIPIGDGMLRLRVEHAPEGARIADAEHPSLALSIGAPPAPLWGTPIDSGSLRTEPRS